MNINTIKLQINKGYINLLHYPQVINISKFNQSNLNNKYEINIKSKDYKPYAYNE